MNKQQLQTELVELLKINAPEVQKNTVRGIIAAISERENRENITLTEEQILAIIRKEVSKREETISFLKKAGREFWVEELEISILKQYLPKEPSDEEYNSAVNAAISGKVLTKKDFGAVMKEIKVANPTFDMKKVSQILNTKLCCSA